MLHATFPPPSTLATKKQWTTNGQSSLSPLTRILSLTITSTYQATEGRTVDDFLAYASQRHALQYRSRCNVGRLGLTDGVSLQ